MPQGGAAKGINGEACEGISINYFINYTNFLSGSLPEINLRILDACGK